MIPYIHENLFKQNSVRKELQITDGNSINLDNADIYLENFELTENCCQENDLIFGECNSSKVSFTTTYLGELKDKTLSISVVLDDDSNNPFRLGYFKVFEDKLTADKTKKEVVAYDALYDILNANVIDWYDTILPTSESTVTLKQFRDSFFLHFGISQETITLPNDSMSIEKTVSSDMLSGADVIRAICELNACFGRINRSGNFQYYYLGSTAYEVGENYSYISANTNYADYETELIDKLIIRETETDIGVIIGSGTNAYIIQNNFLLYGKSSSEISGIANNIYSRINTISFTPCNINIPGNPCLEVGDKIEVNLKNGNTITSYILSRVYKGIQAQKDTFTANGNRERLEQINDTNSQLNQLRGKSNRLERTIEYTRSEITNVAAGLHSEITQTAEGLEIEIQNLQSQIDGEIEYFERSGPPTLTNYPAWDFTSAFKCDGTKKCAPLYKANMTLAEEGETGQYPHFYYSEQDYQDHLRDLVFDTTNALSYRFNKQTDGDTTTWFWQEIADSETAYILQQISELKITAEELSSDMTSVEATIGSQGLQIQTNTSNITQTASDISAEVTRATSAEDNLSGRLDVQADNISAKVSKTGGNNSSFGWNLTSNAFDLYSGGNRVFRCNSSGIYINGNGTFTGTINASGGTLGGWTISSGGIYKTNGNITIRMQSDGTFVCQRGSTTLWALQNDGNVQFNGNCTINGYATSASVSAVDGKINNLQSIAITTQNLSAQTIRGSQISAGTISADKLNSSSLAASRLDIGTIASPNSFMFMGGNQYVAREVTLSTDEGTFRYRILANRIY